MLTAYVPRGTSLEAIAVEEGGQVPPAAVWIDLVHPTLAEDRLVENLVGIAIPTKEEMQEIEISSRLYIENGARYMTATLLFQQDTPVPKTTPVTFILSGHRLITVRYDEPRPFAITRHRLGRSCPSDVTGESVLIDLLDAVIDRAADVLERIGTEVDDVSTRIFDPQRSRAAQVYNALLRTIGGKGDHTSKVRESLLSIGRLLIFVVNEAEGMRWSKENRAQLKSMHRDVQSLTDHAGYLSNKIIFLLDALVGVVSIEQNNIIKIFSVAAVVFLPPTLVASIYGMNFKHLPELDWSYGYPMALGLMVAAAVLPYLYFKWRKWL
ncbi:MAG: magnesium transporter CorA family protein [Pseudorhodoplanes sp.]